MLIYFGYTFCPDVCPVGLQTIAETMDRLGEDAKHFQPLFITLDPERDSPEILRDYVGAFHPRLIGLTGTRIMIDRVAKSYRVRHMRSGESKPGDDNYLIDHTSAIFLMGPEGEYLGRFSHNADPQVVAEKLRKAVQQ
jgi:protein SCO1/2